MYVNVKPNTDPRCKHGNLACRECGWLDQSTGERVSPQSLPCRAIEPGDFCANCFVAGRKCAPSRQP